jgi:hypothetical protein
LRSAICARSSSWLISAAGGDVGGDQQFGALLAPLRQGQLAPRRLHAQLREFSEYAQVDTAHLGVPGSGEVEFAHSRGLSNGAVAGMTIRRLFTVS